MNSEYRAENLEQNEELAQKLEAVFGDEVNDRVNQRLLLALKSGGKEAARIFCINEFDKFITRPKVVAFLEREIFDAGEDGLSTPTPWNSLRRSKLKKD